MIVTGGNSGLGYQCAKNIAMKDKDYTLVLACRNPEKAAKAIQDIKTETGNKNIFSVALDLASLDSVRTFGLKADSHLHKLRLSPAFNFFDMMRSFTLRAPPQVS